MKSAAFLEGFIGLGFPLAIGYWLCTYSIFAP